MSLSVLCDSLSLKGAMGGGKRNGNFSRRKMFLILDDISFLNKVFIYSKYFITLENVYKYRNILAKICIFKRGKKVPKLGQYLSVSLTFLVRRSSV